MNNFYEWYNLQKILHFMNSLEIFHEHVSKCREQLFKKKIFFLKLHEQILYFHEHFLNGMNVFLNM